MRHLQNMRMDADHIEQTVDGSRQYLSEAMECVEKLESYYSQLQSDEAGVIPAFAIEAMLANVRKRIYETQLAVIAAIGATQEMACVFSAMESVDAITRRAAKKEDCNSQE